MKEREVFLRLPDQEHMPAAGYLVMEPHLRIHKSSRQAELSKVIAHTSPLVYSSISPR